MKKTLLALLGTAGLAMAADSLQSPREDEFYPITTIATPDGAVVEPGGIELLDGKKLAVGTRRGDIWIVEGAYENPPQPKWTKFASGLHEILGLSWQDGWFYVSHRPEMSRVKDSDGDGKADIFETVCDKWGINGDYHEYAFGSRPDKEGNRWVVLCLTGSFNSSSPWRGWCVRVAPDGRMIPTCSGIRSPGGIGEDADGEMYYTDNQGPWNGSSSLKWLKPGSFQGHPDSFKWYPESGLGETPVVPATNSRIVTERERVKEFVPPACILPHDKLGHSSSGIACDTTGGKFGVFQKQLFVADQSFSNVSRVYLETVGGLKQGAVFPFRWGFKSGCVPLRMAPDGTLWYGGTARGWGARGGKDFCLERVNWTGKVPFEVHEMHAKPDGFEFTFTQPADPATLANIASWKVNAFCYIYRADYGSPEVDPVTPVVTSVDVAPDGKSARVHLDKLTKGHIHEFHLTGVKDTAGQPLIHDAAYYTLNNIPAK